MYQWGYTGMKIYFCKNILRGIISGSTQEKIHPYIQHSPTVNCASMVEWFR